MKKKDMINTLLYALLLYALVMFNIELHNILIKDTGGVVWYYILLIFQIVIAFWIKAFPED